MLIAVGAAGPRIAVHAEMTITPDDPAEVTASIRAQVLRSLQRRRRTEPHECVVDGEIRALTALLVLGDKLPAAFSQKAVVAAGVQLSAVCEANSVDRLDGAPVSQHSSSHVATIVTTLLGAVNLITDSKARQRLVTAIRHENSGVASQAVDAAMLAAAIRIDRLVEGNVRRVVARDDRARRLRLHDRRERRQLLIEIAPAVVDFFGARRLEAPGGIRHRAAPAARARSGGRSHV